LYRLLSRKMQLWLRRDSVTSHLILHRR
jgi:hypothetical protein